MYAQGPVTSPTNQEAKSLPIHKETPIDALKRQRHSIPRIIELISQGLVRNPDAQQHYVNLLRIAYTNLIEAEENFLNYVDRVKPELTDEDALLYAKLQKRKAAGSMSKLSDDLTAADIINKLKKEYNDLWAKDKDSELR